MNERSAARYQPRQDEKVAEIGTRGILPAAFDGVVSERGNAELPDRLDVQFVIRSGLPKELPLQPGENRNGEPVDRSEIGTRLAEALDNDIEPAPSLISRVPASPSPQERFDLLQQWEGVVRSIDEAEGEFSAELSDLTDPTSADEEATFLIADVSQGDRALLVPGAVFRWSIGYRHGRGGQLERVSRLRFMRIPGWRRSEVDEIERAADAAYRSRIHQT